MQLYQFYQDVSKRPERLGQAAFNLLSEVRPELANEIAGTDCDPYYAPDKSNTNWKNFANFLATSW